MKYAVVMLKYENTNSLEIGYSVETTVSFFSAKEEAEKYISHEKSKPSSWEIEASLIEVGEGTHQGPSMGHIFSWEDE